ACVNPRSASRSACWLRSFPVLIAFFFLDTAPALTYTLSLHDALPILFGKVDGVAAFAFANTKHAATCRDGVGMFFQKIVRFGAVVVMAGRKSGIPVVL